MITKQKSQAYNVSAIIITYNPELKRLIKVLSSLKSQKYVNSILIVDNFSKNRNKIKAITNQGCKYLQMNDNYGIAKALNSGIRALLKSDVDFILTMDQDTTLHKGALHKLFASYDQLNRETKNRVGILALSDAPYKQLDGYRKVLDSFLFTSNEIGGFIEKKFVFTSGNLLKKEIIDDLKLRFNEALFIDLVDFDFDMKLNKKGYIILQHGERTINHRLGKQVKIGNIIKGYENETRIYYIARNSTYLLLNVGFPLGLYILQLFDFSRTFMHVKGLRGLPLLLKAISLGINDGIKGRLGKIKYSL